MAGGRGVGLNPQNKRLYRLRPAYTVAVLFDVLRFVRRDPLERFWAEGHRYDLTLLFCAYLRPWHEAV